MTAVEVHFRLLDSGDIEFTHQCGWRKRTEIVPVGPDSWTVQQADPLTVTPSLNCQGCDLHGFITEGRWVD